MKFFMDILGFEPRTVTPLAGVWIEIKIVRKLNDMGIVTPLAGVWIEIVKEGKYCGSRPPSLPLRECGLKFDIQVQIVIPT